MRSTWPGPRSPGSRAASARRCRPVSRQTLDTGARPNLTLGAGDSLRDVAGNPAGRTSARADDGAAPVVVSAATGDGGGTSGRIDSVSVTFSEAVSHRADSDGAYPFSIPGYSIASAGDAVGRSLALKLNEGGSADSGATPPVGYARGTGFPVTDSSGNEAAGGNFAGTRDGVAPVLMSVSLLDRDFDGMVDGARYDYSETVTHPTSDCRSSCSFSLAGYALEVAGGAAGASVTVGVTEEPDGATVTTAGYSSLGEGVSDPAGNRAPSATMPTADASPPVVVSSETVDADGNARIDRVDLTFSEPISSAADAAAPFSLAAAGYTVDSVGAASGEAMSVFLVEKPGADTGSAPAVSYTGQGTRLADLNGTEHALRSYPGLTRDAVAPRFIEAQTADVAPAAGDGRLDALDLIYSEELEGAASTSPFSVAGRSVTDLDLLADRVRVRFDEVATGGDTDARPAVTYDAGTGDLRDLPEGAGDVAESAPGVAGAMPRDAAGPAVIGASTGEEQDGASPDGRLDSVRVALLRADPGVVRRGGGRRAGERPRGAGRCRRRRG